MSELIQDYEKCNRCGGKCCLIYLSPRQGGYFPEGSSTFERWVQRFHDAFWRDKNVYGVQPLFNPYLAHMVNQDTYRDELKAKGIDINRCQFCGPKGCLIPWERRPLQCKTYKCNEWDEL